MQNKLLPCPFCGGEAYTQDHNFWDEKTSSFDTKGYSVHCCECSACMKPYVTKEEAIEHWNTRKPLERILEQLEVLHELVNDNQKLAVSQSTDIVRKGVDMERLTKRENDRAVLYDYDLEEMKGKFLDDVNDVVDCVNLEFALEKLAEYEDAEGGIRWQNLH